MTWAWRLCPSVYGLQDSIRCSHGRHWWAVPQLCPLGSGWSRHRHRVCLPLGVPGGVTGCISGSLVDFLLWGWYRPWQLLACRWWDRLTVPLSAVDHRQMCLLAKAGCSASRGVVLAWCFSGVRWVFLASVVALAEAIDARLVSVHVSWPRPGVQKIVKTGAGETRGGWCLPCVSSVGDAYRC